MEDGYIYVYDFSELLGEVKNVETQISEFASSQSEQVSEMISIASEIAENTEAIKTHAYREEILMFAVICFIGVVCGLLGALTWRSNKNG